MCALAVEHQIGYTKRLNLPTDAAVQLVPLGSPWRGVSVVSQRKVCTPLFKKSSKISFKNQARWSRRPLLVISTVVNNEDFLN